MLPAGYVHRSFVGRCGRTAWFTEQVLRHIVIPATTRRDRVAFAREGTSAFSGGSEISSLRVEWPAVPEGFIAYAIKSGDLRSRARMNVGSAGGKHGRRDDALANRRPQ